ncbi:MAG: hypothetical protein IKC23_10800 [Fibrobacter sp.]|nr:hypothetical protein [Fibrobacter sp.]MBR2900091.1 hypothetical protein [Fibrobacter sp.]
MEKFKDSIAPEELAWYELIANSERCREIPETATELIRDAYERLRVRRTPKQILERQARDMIPSAMIDDLIDEAVTEAVSEEKRKLAKEMLDNDIPQEKVAVITGIPLNEIRKMR